MNILLIIFIILCAFILITQTRGIVGGNRVKDLDKYPASRFETAVRQKIELLTGKKFPCVYPKWLKYKGKQLELDGYNEELNLAFETQGPQHTKFSSKTDPKYIKYKNRVKNDMAKIRLAEKNNVGLVIVDYKVPKYLLGSYVRSRIYDIAAEWKKKGLWGHVDKLGVLADKAGDYVEPIINEAVVDFERADGT